MKKLLIVFNGIDYPSYLVSYGIRLAKQDHSTLQAVVMRPISLANAAQYPFPNDLALTTNQTVSFLDTSYNRDIITANLQLFKDECSVAALDYMADITIYDVDDLIEQSAFSDLILSDYKVTFGDYSLQELLADTHCPVLVVTEKAALPTKAILCYDESFSSIYAIKMYSYLFPDWRNLPTELVSINPKNDNVVKYDQYLQNWLPKHFPVLQKKILEGNLHHELISCIRKDDQHSIVVMGAYGRNAVSRLFHKSLANIVFEETNAAVFVIHE